MGVIEVDLFSEDIDSTDHPEVIEFRELLEEVAEEYHCTLRTFDIVRGTVSFSFDSDELMSDVLKILRNE